MENLSVYLHIPFCVRKCAYCDFYSGAFDDGSKALYLDTLLREIREAGETSRYDHYRVSTIYFGGGTPSLLHPDQLYRLMSALRESFRISGDAEITLEGNPGTLDEEKLLAFREAGINRLSLGLQSTEDSLLLKLGRIHTYREFLETYESARKTGFGNISVDLMSGIPGLTPEAWEKTLKKVVRLSPDHLSAYSLMIEENTPFWGLYGENGSRTLELPSEEQDREMVQRTGEILSEAGMHQYEISNYAVPGKESRHNSAYWTGQDYLGLGAAAASFLPAEDRGNGILKRRSRHAGSLRYDLFPDEEEELLTKEDLMSEFMILGLRMTAGVSDAEFRRRFGESFFERYRDIIAKLKPSEVFEIKEDRLLLSPYGRDVSNRVMVEFLP